MTEPRITSINLTGDATHVTYSDGSQITGQARFTRSDGSTGTVASVTLVSEDQGQRVVQTTSTASDGTRTDDAKSYDASGKLVSSIHSVTSADGLSIATAYDDTGDGVTDRLQTIVTTIASDGTRTETLTNKAGSTDTSAVLMSKEVKITSADGHSITINRDSQGAGWFDSQEVRSTLSDGSHSIVTTSLTQNGNVLAQTTSVVSGDGMTRTDSTDADGNGTVDTISTLHITTAADGTRTEETSITNNNGSLRSSVTQVFSNDGKAKVISTDVDGNGTTDLQEIDQFSVASSGDTTTTITLKNGDGYVLSFISSFTQLSIGSMCKSEAA